MSYQSPYFKNTDEDPEYEARKVLAEVDWDGSLPIDLIDICEKYGLEYIFAPDSSMQEEGSTKFREEGDFYIFINTKDSDCVDGFSNNLTKRRRQRFTFAHELAHCSYESHTDLNVQVELGNKKNPHGRMYQKVRENQANQFAAHLLMPREAFRKFSRQVGWTNISRLIQRATNEFDVSMEVAAQQISRLAEYPCISILFDRNGTPKRTPVYSEEFKETKLFYPKHQNVPGGTAAEQLLSTSNQNAQSRKKFPDASIWFIEAPDWRAEKFSITETSLRLGQYGVLTFLEVSEVETY